MKRKKSSVTSHQFSEQEIISALEQFTQAGNISVKEFTAAFQISAATFYNWRKRYGNQLVESNAPVGFIDVDLSPVQQEPVSGTIFAEYRGIVFYQRV
ncbi:IS66 family insertion sequence element accessory protein TnpA, partial [Chitinophaga sancti]